MLILISLFTGILLLCAIALVAFCNVKKRSLFAFGFFITLLVLVALMVTGDITIAYGG